MRAFIASLSVVVLIVLGVPQSASAATPICFTRSQALNTVMHNVWTTGYSWWDNTPAGSGSIAYPPSGRNTAGGTGTYADPITLAVGWCLNGSTEVPDWQPGSRWYIPNLRKYFRTEDQCGDTPSPQTKPCHTPEAGAFQVDLWVDGRASVSVSESCMSAITKIVDAVANPSSGFAVVPGPISGSRCATQYGNTLVRV